MKSFPMAILLSLFFLPFHFLQSNVVAYHDFSYLKFVHNATEMPEEHEYDYIIVGGGTAGCPLAATLSEKYSVLILERGGSPQENPNVLSQNGFLANLMETENGLNPAQRFISEDGVVNARGRVLGGTSMINAGFYSRADKDFYQNSGVDWDMDMVESSYKWVEDTILFSSDLEEWQSIVKHALLGSNVLPDNGFTLDHVVGTKISASTFDEAGDRHGAVELLNNGYEKNLVVALHAYVDRLLFFPSHKSGLSAVGVIYTDSLGKCHKAILHEKGEVILSAGAIGSPQLLLLSGIGPFSYLSSMNIPPIHDHPNVGKFVNDNPRNGIAFVSSIPLNASKLHVVGITNNYYVESISLPSQFYLPPPYGLFPTSSPPIDLNVAVIAEKIPGPLSQGTFRLESSTDVKTSPVIKFNYFSHPLDLARCVDGIRKIGEMLETEIMDKYKFENSDGTRDYKFVGGNLPKNKSDAALEEFCRKTVTTIWHYHGGCLVGKVVDGDYKVMGINGLRVVDGSTFTQSPGTNPQATLMMLGRYVGVKMLQERKGKS